MTAAGPEPPRLGRLLVRVRPLGERRAEVEADLEELFARRVAVLGRRRAAWRYLADAASLWFHHRPELAPVRSRRGAGNHLRHDIVYTFRLCRRQPGLFGVVVGGLTLAVGLSTTVFSIVDGALLRAGIPDPQSVFGVVMTPNRDLANVTGGDSAMSGQWLYSDYRVVQDGFEDVALAAAARDRRRLRLHPGGDGPADSGVGGGHAFTLGLAVSGNYFAVLGGAAEVGRVLNAQDDDPAAPRVIVVSDPFWSSRLGHDRDIVGGTVWLDDEPYTVVGVAARGFAPNADDHQPPAFWVSLGSQAQWWAAEQAALRDARRARLASLGPAERGEADGPISIAQLQALLSVPPRTWNPPVDVVGRAAPRLTRDQTRAEIEARAASVVEDPPPGRPLVTLRPFHALGGGRDGAMAIGLIGAAITLTVLVAAANLANVSLASAAGRSREIGTRLALGASRGRIVCQLLTESLILGGCGAGLGLLLALWMTPICARFVHVLPTIDVTPSPAVYGLVLVAGLSAGLGSGLAPARLLRRGSLLSALKTDRQGAPTGCPPGRLRAVLVGAQAAASIVLLVLAALLTRSAVRAVTIDLGFDPDRVVSFSASFGRGTDDAQERAYWHTAIDRLRAMPGVAGVAEATAVPFAESASSRSDGVAVHRNWTSAEYFDTVGLRILRGRAYTADEVTTGAAVAVVSASLAHRYWGGANPIGSTLTRVWGHDDPSGRPPSLTAKPAGTRVIGVVSDAVMAIGNADALTIYMPLRSTLAGRVIVRTAGNAGAQARPIRTVLEALNPDPGFRVLTRLARDDFDEAMGPSRILAVLASVIGVSTLVLAAIGLFGVTAFAVTERRQEVGVRMTLGATSAAILAMLLKEGLRPVVVGLGSGVVLALVAGRVIQRALFGVGTHDPLAIAAAIVVLLGAATAAIGIPARRAAGLDPAATLRES